MRKLLNILLLTLALSYAHVQAQEAFSPVLLTEAEYEQFTYSWTDANGVVHPNTKLTEKAESTEQIMALIKEVYSNPNIPGSWYGEPARRDHAIPYGNNKSFGRNVTGNKPNREGYTLLLVAVKDSWTNKLSTQFSNVRDYITEAIKWVKLVPNGVHISETGDGPNNSGVIFNIDETLNRFYFISKGRYRKYTEMPFLNMFELFSPTTDAEGIETTDFYKKMLDGQIYSVVHDCGSVESAAHYFSMSGKKGTESKQVTDLVFYIGDYRFENWRIDSNNYRDKNHVLTWYNPSYAPKTLMYTIQLTATRSENRVETTDGSRKYSVTLDWTSSLNKIVPNSDLVQGYDIYIVVNGVRQPAPIATGITANTYTYEVPQELKGYDITYQISGQPINTEFKKAWSNTDVVTIPGYDPFERLNLSIIGNYKSSYDQTREVNNYENLITMTNNNADPSTALRGNMIDGNTTFELYRFDAEVAGAPLEHVATVKMGEKFKNETTHLYEYPYTVTYDNRVSNITYPSTSGRFTSETPDGEITLGENGLQLLDAFAVSTAHNDHASHYDYQVKFVSAIDILHPDGETKSRDAYSNVVRVPVLKTNVEVEDVTYSREEIMADTDHNLNVANATSIDVRVNNYSATRDILLRRDAKTDVARIQKNQDGTYTSFKRDNTGLNTVIETRAFVANETFMDMVVDDDSRDLTNAQKGLASYVGIVEAYTTNDVNETTVSTYGCDIKHVALANLSIDINYQYDPILGSKGYVVTAPIENKSGEKFSLYCTNLDLNAYLSETLKVNADNSGIPNFRLWRIYKGKETSINGERQTFKGNVTELDLGYRTISDDNKHLLLQDCFLGEPLDKDEKTTVTYVARVYAEAEDAQADSRLKDADDDQRYYIAEARIDVHFEHGIHTAVDAVSIDCKPVATRYINAQGVVSDTPFVGFNIVVTQYSNGTTQATKVVKNE